MKKTETASLPGPNLLSMELTNPSTGGEESRNWEELPSDVMTTILMKLEPREILESTQLVCKSWHRACKDPEAWTRIEIVFYGEPGDRSEYEKIAYAAVNRSCDRLLEILVYQVCDDLLLLHIAERSSNLRCLRVRFCYGQLYEDGFCEAVKLLPLLEEVEFTITEVESSMIKAVGQSCPKLVSFKLNKRAFSDAEFLTEYHNENALAIAETMPRIRHLELIGSFMTNEGLHAILDGCCCLESLDLRACFKLDLSGYLGKRCAEQVKLVKWPNDSTSDCCFQVKDNHDYRHEMGHGDYLSGEDDDGYDFGYSDDLEYDICTGNYDFSVLDVLDDDDDNELSEFGEFLWRQFHNGT